MKSKGCGRHPGRKAGGGGVGAQCQGATTVGLLGDYLTSHWRSIRRTLVPDLLAAPGMKRLTHSAVARHFPWPGGGGGYPQSFRHLGLWHPHLEIPGLENFLAALIFFSLLHLQIKSVPNTVFTKINCQQFYPWNGFPALLPLLWSLPGVPKPGAQKQELSRRVGAVTHRELDAPSPSPRPAFLRQKMTLAIAPIFVRSRIRSEIMQRLLHSGQ